MLLLRTLPKKQPGTVETIQTGAVFDQTDNTAAPDREQAYDGELPNLSDTLEPDEAETPAPEDEAALAAAKLADQTLASMTLDEKLWQLFFVTPEAITKVETATLAGEATKAAIESQPVGGLVYFAKEPGEPRTDRHAAGKFAVLFQNSAVPRRGRGGRHGLPPEDERP